MALWSFPVYLIVRIMYIMLNNEWTMNNLESELCRQPHAVDETRRIILVPQLVLHVLDIG